MPSAKVNLSKRLSTLSAMANSDYTQLWDCCCDHGLLGAELLSQPTAAHIHFVDIVPALMAQLEQKLTQFFPQEKNDCENIEPLWSVHCMDVAALPVGDYSGKQLIIIAGIGGELMADMVKAIHHNHPATYLDFLLCPVNHAYSLRQQLIALDYRLQNELLIAEKGRFYEALLVSKRESTRTEPIVSIPASNVYNNINKNIPENIAKNINKNADKNTNSEQQNIHPVGSLLWQTKSPEELTTAKAYLEKLLAHYRRINLNPSINVQPIIDAYAAVNID